MTVKKTFTLLFMACALSAQAIDINTIPDANANGRVGASMPYTRYDSEDAKLGGNANLKFSTNYDPRNIATQASNRSYIALPDASSYAEWTAVRSGQGVTIRFTLPDAKSGTDGLRGSLEIYVNGKKRNVRVFGSVKDKIELSSYWAWQYYDAEHTDNASDTYIEGGIPCFAFDEMGFIIEGGINKGDKIRVQNTGENNLECGVDFLEIEKVTKIEQPRNSISAASYGNNVVNAANAAASQGKTLYIPEGTYEIGSKWYLPGNVKIVGAGMFYTNIMFTSSGAGGGGIVCSGGSELSNLHMNTNLHSRHNQGANYKGFEGGPNGFFAHEVWIQHFECGAWFELGNNIRVVNCRLRDNIADGLNFCRSTNNSTVYNCSVRNNGDDGLAMWNHNWECGDESNNKFCYNTVELDWRAGSIGVFGGNQHRVYNNYVCDGVLSAGIRVNTDFPGYGFQNTENIWFDNNYVVNCGTKQDIFGQDLAAVFVRSSNWNGAGEVRNVTFTNTQVYNSQSADIVTVGNIPITNNAGASVPPLPEVDDPESASGGPLEGITGYDLVIDGLAWKNQDGNTNLKQGDKVTFTAKILNKSGVNIPEGVLIGLSISIDGQSSLINNSYNKGLAAGEAVCITTEWTAKAGGHTVTAIADPDNRLPDEMDENNNSREKKLNVTAVGNQVNTNYTPVTGGCDLYVTDVTYENLSRKDGTIQPGDKLRFTAVAVNAGDQATPGGVKHGVQFQVDGKGYNDAPITWSDDKDVKNEYFDYVAFTGPLAGRTFHNFSANGGGGKGSEDGRFYWIAENGTHTVMAWIDDDPGHITEVNENNNKTTITLPTIPYYGIKYIDNPDQPDNLDGTTVEPEPEPTEVTVTIGSTGYATFYYDKPLDFTSVEGLKAYTATGMDYVPNNSDVLKLFISNIKSVPAETGLLLHGNAGTYTIPVGNSSGIYPNLFKGVLRDTYIYAEDGNYRNFVLYNGNKGIGFYPATNGTLSANKVYLPVNKSQVASAKAFVFNIDGEATAIEDVRTAQDTDSDIYHTLTGIRVIRPAKGVYIHNGRKVVIR